VSLRRRKESLSREASLEGVRRQVSVDPGEPTLQDKPQLPVKGYMIRITPVKANKLSINVILLVLTVYSCKTILEFIQF
jgi:hypothetical protein